MQENTGQTRGPSGLDLNVEPAWIQGITGRGIMVGFVDDGRAIQECLPLHYEPMHNTVITACMIGMENSTK